MHEQNFIDSIDPWPTPIGLVAGNYVCKSCPEIMDIIEPYTKTSKQSGAIWVGNVEG